MAVRLPRISVGKLLFAQFGLQSVDVRKQTDLAEMPTGAEIGQHLLVAEILLRDFDVADADDEKVGDGFALLEHHLAGVDADQRDFVLQKIVKLTFGLLVGDSAAARRGSSSEAGRKML